MRVMPAAPSREPSARRAWSAPVRQARLDDPGGRSQAGRPRLVRAPPVHHRAHSRRAAPGRRRARLPVARLVQRLVPVRAEHGALQPRPDPGVRVLDLAEDPAAAAHLCRCNNIATPDGAGRRGDDLRAGQAPLRRAGLAGHAGHRAGALRRVRDPARAPDHGRRAVPVPADAGRHRAAVGPRAVAAPVRARRRPARPGRDHALGRAAAARGVRRVHDHQAGQLAEGRGHHRGLPGPGVRLRGTVLRASTGSSR